MRWEGPLPQKCLAAGPTTVFHAMGHAVALEVPYRCMRCTHPCTRCLPAPSIAASDKSLQVLHLTFQNSSGEVLASSSLELSSLDVPCNDTFKVLLFPRVHEDWTMTSFDCIARGTGNTMQTSGNTPLAHRYICQCRHSVRPIRRQVRAQIKIVLDS